MAETNDVLTLDEGKRALQISAGDSVDNTVLAGYITAVSVLLDQEAGPIVRRTITDERLDGSGRQQVTLRHRPVTSVTSVTEHQGTVGVTITAEAAGTTPGQAYLADRYEADPSLLDGTLRRRSGGCDWFWWYGRQNIVVTYEAGRFADTDSVPARFKRAAGICLENLWRDRQPGVIVQEEFDVPHQSFPGFALPNAARQLLAREVGLDAPWGYA